MSISPASPQCSAKSQMPPWTMKGTAFSLVAASQTKLPAIKMMISRMQSMTEMMMELTKMASTNHTKLKPSAVHAIIGLDT
mgnify:CR=1 FL=1